MLQEFVDAQEKLLQDLGAELLALFDRPLEPGEEVSLRADLVESTILQEAGAKWAFRIERIEKDGTQLPFIVRPSMQEIVSQLQRLCLENADQAWSGLQFRLWFDTNEPRYECHFVYPSDATATVH